MSAQPVNIPPASTLTPEMRTALRALPKCPDCDTPKIFAECSICRALAAENKLLGLSGGDDSEWIQRTRLIADGLSGEALTPLGFNQPISRHDGTYRVTMTSWTPFKPVALMVPRYSAGGLLLDIQIGKQSVFAQSTRGLPLLLFCPEMWTSPDRMPKIKCPAAIPGQQISLHIAPAPKLDPIFESAIEATGQGVYSSNEFHAVMWGLTGPIAELTDLTDEIEALAVVQLRQTPMFQQLVDQIRARLSAETGESQ